MAIEINQKVKKEKKASSANIIFYLALILFLACLAGYFVIGFYQDKMKNEITGIEGKLKNTPDEIALETEIFGSDNSIGYQQKIKDFGSLLGLHKLPLNLLNFLEENTHPKVWFSNFDLDLQKNLLKMSGVADSFEILGQQALMFKTQNFIKNINLSEVSLGKEGKINFDLQFTIDPIIFK